MKILRVALGKWITIKDIKVLCFSLFIVLMAAGCKNQPATNQSDQIESHLNNVPRSEGELNTLSTDQKNITKTQQNNPALDHPGSETFMQITNKTSINASSNGAYYIFGKTSPNCSKIVVQAGNGPANMHDTYELANYKKGDTNFKYGIRQDLSNLGIGSNLYAFTAYCEGGQTITETVTFYYAPSFQEDVNDHIPSTTVPTYPAISKADIYKSKTAGTIVYKESGCDYFIVENDEGYILAEWMGGNDPDVDDIIAGDFNSYGMKDFYNLNAESGTRLWIDDYMLSKSSAMEDYFDKCN